QAAKRPRGQSRIMRQLCPRIAAVGRLEHPRAWSAVPQQPRLAVDLPGRAVERIRVVVVDDQVNNAGAVVAKEDFLPHLAAVARAIDAALFVLAERMAERRDINDVRIRGMDAHASDGLRIVEAEVDPRLTRVVRSVNAVALEYVAAELDFPHAD